MLTMQQNPEDLKQKTRKLKVQLNHLKYLWIFGG